MLLCAEQGAYWCWERTAQFSCSPAFTDARVTSWKRIYLVIVNLPRIIHSERETTSFLSSLLFPLTSIHSGVFLRWLSLSHPLLMEDFAVCLWERYVQATVFEDSLAWLSHLTVLMVVVWYICYLYQKQSLPPILPSLHFISLSGAAEENVKTEMLGHHTLRLG